MGFPQEGGKPLSDVIIGYDIGKMGGIAILYDGLMSLYNNNGIAKFASLLPEGERIVVYAEDVHAFPGQGSVSTGSLMQSKGELIGAVESLREWAGLDISLKLIQPLEWIKRFTAARQKNFKSKTLWKKHLLYIAKETICSGFLVNDITLNTADAVLMCYYGQFKEQGVELPDVSKIKLKFK
jgi:hypothetical protein